MRKIAHSLSEFQEEAARFARTLHSSSTGATLVTLSGELGAGKTTFTQAVAETLGVKGAVTSPTFVLEKIYPLLGGGQFQQLVHIDAYRLETGKDLTPLDFEKILGDKQNLIMLEWPERVNDALPTPAARISFSAEEDGSHSIVYD